MNLLLLYVQFLVYISQKADFFLLSISMKRYLGEMFLVNIDKPKISLSRADQASTGLQVHQSVKTLISLI